MGAFEAFCWAAAAGLVVSLLDHAAMAGLPRRQRPFDFTDPAYLLKFIGHPLAGGLLAAAIATLLLSSLSAPTRGPTRV